MSPLFIALAFAGASVAAPPPPGYVQEVLPNGLSVSILPDATSPVVSTQVWYQVGSAHEDAGSRGLAHLFEHLMFGATASRSDEEYWELHHRTGGNNNAFTGFDETVYTSEILPEHHLAVLEHEADRMVGLELTPERVANEIRIVTEELRLATENDPLNRVLVQATRALLGEHPYAYWPSGTKEDLAAVGLESCRVFYERYYGPANAHLVVVGPVDSGTTLPAVRRLFGSIRPRGEIPEEVPALDTWVFPAESSFEDDLPPVELAIYGFPLPPPAHENYAAIELLGYLLSGGARNPFRDELVVRRKKAVEAGVQVLQARRGGAIAFYSAHVPYRRKKTAYRIMDRAMAELSGLFWLTEDHLVSAKRALLREETGRRYYSASRADAIGRARLWQGDGVAAFQRAARIEAVTLDDVRGVFERDLGREPVRIYVRPERVPVWIRLFGWLYPLVS